MNEKYKPSKNGSRYCFVNYKQESCGSIPISVTITNSHVLSVIVDVISAHVSFLIELYFLEKFASFVNNIENTFCALYLSLKVPSVLNCGHI